MTLSILSGTLVLAAATAVYGLGRAFYLLWLHPLAKVPGPKLYALGDVMYVWHIVRGDWPFRLKQLHDQYGPAVRFTPNDVSFTDPEAWKIIHGHKTDQSRLFDKDDRMYNPSPSGRPHLLLADNINHRRQRRILSHAFSDKALRGQEDIIKQYVDKFIANMGRLADSGDVFNMVMWYNFTTFDLIGDLAFGKSFGCLDKGVYDPWIGTVFHSIKLGAYRQAMRRIPLLGLFRSVFIPEKSRRAFLEHGELSRQTAEQRVRAGVTDRDDFMSYILRHNNDDKKGMTEDEICDNASTLITGGSETTATLLSGATYHLLMNPKYYDRLVAEIRGTFQVEEDIDLLSVSKLTYLDAVLAESFRMHPPAAPGMSRFTPSGGETISGYYIPEKTAVSIPQLSAYRCKQNWFMPESFLPERWLVGDDGRCDSRFADDKKDVLKPFGYGPRDCLGKNLANLEMRVIMTRLLYSFDLQLMPESRNWADQRIWTFWDKGELLVKLTRRPHGSA